MPLSTIMMQNKTLQLMREILLEIDMNLKKLIAGISIKMLLSLKMELKTTLLEDGLSQNQNMITLLTLLAPH